MLSFLGPNSCMVFLRVKWVGILFGPKVEYMELSRCATKPIKCGIFTLAESDFRLKNPDLSSTDGTPRWSSNIVKVSDK